MLNTSPMPTIRIPGQKAGINTYDINNWLACNIPGKMRDDATLRDHKVVKGSKIMVIGSTVTDVMSVSAPDAQTMKEIAKQDSASGKEPLCKQKVSAGESAQACTVVAPCMVC